MSRWNPRTLRHEARRMRDATRPGADGDLPATPPPSAPPSQAASSNGQVSGDVVSPSAVPNPSEGRPAGSSFEAALENARTGPSEAPRSDAPEALEIQALRAAGAVIGQRVVLEHGAYVDAEFAWLVTIEDDVVLAAGAQVLSHDGATRQALGHTLLAPVRIGAGSYVGAGATILPGVTIGRDAIVGAGSIVSRDVEAETVVAGIPARVICSVRDLVARHAADVEAAKAAGLWGITTQECANPDHRAELLARMRRIGRIYVR